MRAVLYLILIAASLGVLGITWDYASVPRLQPMNPSSVNGAAMPVVTLRDVKGRKVALSDLRTPYMLINFWATWCAPCKQEIPLLAEMASRQPERVTLVMVSVDDATTDIDHFLKQFDATTRQHLAGANVIIVRDAGQRIAQQFQVYRYPETYVIGPERRIIRKIVGIIPADAVPTVN